MGLPACKVSRFLITFVVLAAIVITGVVLIGRSSSKSEIRHVLLISMDTCRADHLGCYGFQLDTTPVIDTLAEKAYLFQNVISPVPMTLPAHSSMMTGTIPPYHGVHDNLNNRLAKSNVTLAEVLKDNGFLTGAFVSSFVLNSQFGLDQGFDVYDDQFKNERTFGDLAERPGGEISDLAVNWYADNWKKKTFLFLHYYDPHTDYSPPEPFLSRFSNNPYAGEIAYTDYCIGRVVDQLKKLGIYEETLIIVTGDHGEMLGEHGEATHSYFIYKSAVRVPLIIKLPGQKTGHRIASVAGLVDIVPTIYGLLRVESPSPVQGVDLSNLWDGSPDGYESRYLYSESLTPTKYDGNSLLGIIGDRWKYIQTTRPELYDLQSDPSEARNLAYGAVEQVQTLRSLLEEIIQQQHRVADSDKDMQLSEKDIRHLESLGYVASGSVKEDFTFDQSKTDPKDLIEIHQMDARVGGLISTGDFEEAKVLCERILAEHPTLRRTHHHLARIAMEREDLDTAGMYMRRVLELDPEDAPAYSTLGVVLAKQGNVDAAVQCFKNALEINPEFLEARYNLANMLKKKGELTEAIEQLREVVKADSDLTKARRKLGETLRMQGNSVEAIEILSGTLEKEPDYAETHHNLGIAYEAIGRWEKAITCFERAIEIDVTYADAHHNLASILASHGRLDDAIEHFKQAIKYKPNYSEAQYHLGLALSMTGQTNAALVYFQNAVESKPDWLEPLNAVAWILATHPDEKVREPERAVVYAKRAVKLADEGNPAVWDTLAAAYASANRFDDAVSAARTALEIAGDNSSYIRLTREIDDRLQLYLQSESYTDPSLGNTSN